MKDVPLDFRLRKNEAKNAFVVHLVAGEWEGETDFAFDLTNQRLRRIVERIENNRCTFDDLRDIGANLWVGLMNGVVGSHLENVLKEIEEQAREESAESLGVRFHFRLSLPPELEALPWEALYHERKYAFLSTHPDRCVVRCPSSKIAIPPPPPDIHHRQLRILVVIPSGSGLGVEHEWRSLDVAVSSFLDKIHLERLSGRVDSDSLGDRLRSEHWDIVHFIGHGEQTAGGKTRIRLNSREAGMNERWMEAEQFASLFLGSGVRLAILNCCLGAKPSPFYSLSGLGPFLLRTGVPAVVAMRYEIPDAVAIRFSEKFYRELLRAPMAGRVDLAVDHARRSLYQAYDDDNARSFITPVLFLAQGCEQLFTLESEAPSIHLSEAAAPPQTIPTELIEALRQRRCVPIIGPRVLTAGLTRSSVQVPEARQLARLLAQKFSYPRLRDLELLEAAGDWMSLTSLQCVCQHHVTQEPGMSYYRLIQEIQNAYKTGKPSDLLSHIAKWETPGVFYLYFDGLLEAAFEEHKNPIRVVNGVDGAVPPGSEPLLIHVRGTHKQAESLVLTEQDHDRLWDRIGRMTPEIAELIRGHIGRCPLFLGASPRDPLMRRLSSKLLERTSRNTMGQVFFLCSPGEKGDPYWQELQVVWIEGDLAELATAITRALA